MEDINHIKQLLKSPKLISLISHRNPDGDALGSLLALSNLLTDLGHTCKVISPSEYPVNYLFLKGIKDIIIGDLEDKKVNDLFEKSDIIFCLDFNSLDRVDRFSETILFSKAYKVLIDHHIDPEPFADYYYTNTNASSTCELVYDFLIELELNDKIDIDIGNCLMTGIVTDTGSFKYNTNVRCYEIAAELKSLGIDDYQLHDLIYNSLSEKQLRLLGHCLKDRMEILEEYGTGIIVLNKYDFENYKISRGDTEGIVNYLMMIKGIKLAAFITQQPTIVKISLRSKGDLSVQQIAQNHFNGGGHKNASGGYMHSSLRTVIEKFKEVLPNYVTPRPKNSLES